MGCVVTCVWHNVFHLHNVFKPHPCYMYQNSIPHFGWIIFPCVDILCFVYPFASWWTFGLFPLLDYYEQCSYEHSLCGPVLNPLTVCSDGWQRSVSWSWWKRVRIWVRARLKLKQGVSAGMYPEPRALEFPARTQSLPHSGHLGQRSVWTFQKYFFSGVWRSTEGELPYLNTL